MNTKDISCCFTGHRPSKLPWGHNESDPRCTDIKYQLAWRLEMLYQDGYRHFICGMALGCDMYFAEAVLALKDIHGDVSLEAAIPCAGQTEKWSAGQKDRYEKILAACNKRSLIQQNYSRDCMMRRNRYMVDKSSAIISCFNGSSGGTMNTLVYARRQGLKVHIIDI